MAIIWNKIIPRWGGDTIEPPEAKKDTGYIAGDKPPAKWENWLRKGTYEALDETRDVIEDIDLQLAQIELLKADKAELLDYEEGIWTPTLDFGSGATGISYGDRAGRYIKVGKMVFLQCQITLTSKGISTGNARIGGFPFSAKNVAPVVDGISISFTNMDLTSGFAVLTGNVPLGGSGTTLRRQNHTGNVSVTSANFTDTTTIRGNLVYAIN